MPRRLLSVSYSMFLFGMMVVVINTSWGFSQEHLYSGQPIFKQGGDRCYYVWHEGDTWHIRWTSYRRMLTFTGWVQSGEGKLEKLKRIDVETERIRIRRSGAPVVVLDRQGRTRVLRGRPDVVLTREQDHIEKEGDRKIVFRSRTNYDIDGFNFKVNKEVRVLRIRLEIEGQPRVEDVEIGRNNSHPPHNPFEIKLK